MFKNPQNFKGFTVKIVLGLFKQCFSVQVFFCLFENESLWVALTFYGNKFQVYQLRFILTKHLLVTA